MAKLAKSPFLAMAPAIREPQWGSVDVSDGEIREVLEASGLTHVAIMCEWNKLSCTHSIR